MGVTPDGWSGSWPAEQDKINGMTFRHSGRAVGYVIGRDREWSAWLGDPQNGPAGERIADAPLQPLMRAMMAVEQAVRDLVDTPWSDAWYEAYWSGKKPAEKPAPSHTWLSPDVWLGPVSIDHQTGQWSAGERKTGTEVGEPDTESIVSAWRTGAVYGEQQPDGSYKMRTVNLPLQQTRTEMGAPRRRTEDPGTCVACQGIGWVAIRRPAGEPRAEMPCRECVGTGDQTGAVSRCSKVVANDSGELVK